MAKGTSGIHLSGTVIGILAIIAGVLIIWGVVSFTLVIGVFLIVFGILSLTGK